MRTLLPAAGVCLILTLPPAMRAEESGNNADKVLWRDPGLISTLDLYWGVGSAARAPKPPFTFVQEDLSGTKPKIDVTDAAGVHWSVKLALPDAAHQNEVHAEIAATRLLWAFGYFVDEDYFVSSGQIQRVQNLRRAAAVVGPDGSFTRARFERREKQAEKRGEWNLEENDFKGTRELAGLQAALLLITAWDTMPHNTAIQRVRLADGREEDRYLVTDLGTTFGRMRGGVGKSPSRWNLEAYRESRLVNGIVQNQLQFRAPLLGNKPLTIPLAHAHWFASMATQLSEAQLRQAFEAAGASPEEIAGFSAEVLKRIREMNLSSRRHIHPLARRAE